MSTILTEQKIQRVLGKFMASHKYSVDGVLNALVLDLLKDFRED